MNKFKKFISNLPFANLLIIAIWLIVFGILANRYINVSQTLSTNAKITTVIEKKAAKLIKNGDILEEQLNSSSSNLLLNTKTSHSFLNKLGNNKIIDIQQTYLFTPLGELSASYDALNDRYTLYLNQLPLSQIDNPVVLYAFELADKSTIIIFDAEMVGKDPIYTILDLSSQHKEIIREVGNYQQLIEATLSPSNTCIHLKFRDVRKYSDTSDYQVYQYCGTGNVSKILDVKPKEYYIKKYANLSSKEILALAKDDACLTDNGKSFIMSYRCNYGIRYCFMLKSSTKLVKNAEYITLQKACNDRTSSLFHNQINQIKSD